MIRHICMFTIKEGNKEKNIRVMTIEDYDSVYALWRNTPGMDLNNIAGHDGRRGYIYHTAVLPDYRKQGIARRLVKCAMDALEKEGINKVALLVFEKNEIGNAFWEKMGFSDRNDIVYRNRLIHELERIDT